MIVVEWPYEESNNFVLEIGFRCYATRKDHILKEYKEATFMLKKVLSSCLVNGYIKEDGNDRKREKRKLCHNMHKKARIKYGEESLNHLPMKWGRDNREK